MWTYLAMIVHIMEKDETEYNGWETYVRAKIDASDTSFLPRNTALILQKVAAQEANALGEVAERVVSLERQNERMMKMLEVLVKEAGAMDALKAAGAGGPPGKLARQGTMAITPQRVAAAPSTAPVSRG